MEELFGSDDEGDQRQQQQPQQRGPMQFVVEQEPEVDPDAWLDALPGGRPRYHPPQRLASDVDVGAGGRILSVTNASGERVYCRWVVGGWGGWWMAGWAVDEQWTVVGGWRAVARERALSPGQVKQHSQGISLCLGPVVRWGRGSCCGKAGAEVHFAMCLLAVRRLEVPQGPAGVGAAAAGAAAGPSGGAGAGAARQLPPAAVTLLQRGAGGGRAGGSGLLATPVSELLRVRKEGEGRRSRRGCSVCKPEMVVIVVDRYWTGTGMGQDRKYDSGMAKALSRVRSCRPF